MVKLDKIVVDSSDEVPELIDITQQVADVVGESGVEDGQVLVFAQHTTAAIILQEPELGVLEDFRTFLKEILPTDKDYRHTLAPDHLKDKMPNGHSHCQHLLLGASETIPVSAGKMLLGQFQRIFLVELDRARTRTVIVQVMGE